MTDRIILRLSTAALAIAWQVPAQAQDLPAAAGNANPSSSSPAPAGNEITVTAQKRSQLLIDVPLSVTVVPGAALEAQQATNLQDYLNLVPGLQLNQDQEGDGRLILRGLSTGGTASTVSTYVDETPFGSSSALVDGGNLAGDFDTFDIARIEVLRGPQGTLYGASSLGGVLKYVTNAPDPTKFSMRALGAVETTQGGSLSYRGDAVVNVALASSLALRVSGFYRKDGGWIDSIGTTGTDAFGYTLTSRLRNNVNSADVYGGRAALLYAPSSDFSIRLTGTLQNIRGQAPSTVESDPNTLATLYGRPSQSDFTQQFKNVDYRVYNGLINYNLGFASLTSSTSYTTQKQAYREDATFNLSGIVRALLGAPANDFFLQQNTNDDRFTQEVRLASNKNDVFEWLIGGYYTHEKGLIYQNFVAANPGTTVPIVFPFVLGTVNLNSRYEEYAGFANGTVHLGQHFDVDLGGRYSHNNQNASQTADGVLAGNVPVNSNLRSSDHVFTYSVAPKFKFDEHASLYARVAKGYRPGGPNAIPPDAPAGTPATFAPDTVINYEVGFKGETADHTASLDIDAYRIDWKNIQLLTDINNFGVNINGARARSEGGEFTLTLRPAPGFVTSINGAYTNARLLDDAPALTGGKAGDKLPFTPPYSISVNPDYDWAVGAAKAYFGGSLRFLSKQSADFDGTYRATYGRQRQVPSYTVIDLHAGVNFGPFGIEAYALNLGNSDGKTSVGTLTASGLPVSPNGALLTGEIRPRTFGLSVTASY